MVRLTTMLPQSLLISCLLLSGCVVNIDRTDAMEEMRVERSALFTRDTELHLQSIRDKDIDLMKLTLPDSGELYLTLPDGSMTTTVAEFVEGQSSWFDSVDFTFKTRILKSDHGPEFGYMLVIADYHVPERDGRPYDHQMFVSYVMQFDEDKDRWVVVKDHASTISKTH